MTTQLPPEAISSPGATADPPAAWARAGGRLRLDGDTLITITDIRRIFRLSRTAAYELTRRAGSPDPVRVSARCYQWWARKSTHSQPPFPASMPGRPRSRAEDRACPARKRRARTATE
jgi:hypothetical protein